MLAKHGKTHVSKGMVVFKFACDWLKTLHVCSDWLERDSWVFKKKWIIHRAYSKCKIKAGSVLFQQSVNKLKRYKEFTTNGRA